MWVWDDGAIANSTVRDKGDVSVAKAGVVIWQGQIIFYDRFDLVQPLVVSCQRGEHKNRGRLNEISTSETTPSSISMAKE